MIISKKKIKNSNKIANTNETMEKSLPRIDSNNNSPIDSQTNLQNVSYSKKRNKNKKLDENETEENTILSSSRPNLNSRKIYDFSMSNSARSHR